MKLFLGILMIFLSFPLLSQEVKTSEDSILVSKQEIHFDTTGTSIFGRKMVKRNFNITEIMPIHAEGVIVCKVCVNPSFIVVSSEVLTEKSTIKRKLYLKKTADVLLFYHYEPSDT